jgi:hypothetical protein
MTGRFFNGIVVFSKIPGNNIEQKKGLTKWSPCSIILYESIIRGKNRQGRKEENLKAKVFPNRSLGMKVMERIFGIYIML